jgi:hypothetical protein
MPIAFTVPAAATAMLHEVDPTVALQSLLVPELGAGVDPSVVYQMETLPCGTGVVDEVFPASVRVTVRGKEAFPEAGEMVGAVVVIAEQDEVYALPVWLGAGLPYPSGTTSWLAFGPQPVL